MPPQLVPQREIEGDTALPSNRTHIDIEARIETESQIAEHLSRLPLDLRIKTHRRHDRGLMRLLDKTNLLWFLFVSHALCSFRLKLQTSPSVPDAFDKTRLFLMRSLVTALMSIAITRGLLLSPSWQTSNS